MSAPLLGAPRSSAPCNSFCAWSQNSSWRPSGLPACSHSSNARFRICSSVGWAITKPPRAQVLLWTGGTNGSTAGPILSQRANSSFGESFLVFRYAAARFSSSRHVPCRPDHPPRPIAAVSRPMARSRLLTPADVCWANFCSGVALVPGAHWFPHRSAPCFDR